MLDGRPTSITVPGQEILTADGVALRVSLTARYVVADPVAAVTSDQSYVYRAVHRAPRRAPRGAGRVGPPTSPRRPRRVGPAVGGAVASELARLGIELLGVDVRDVMVPAELKRAFAGIVAARREGEAALERARGETAALRSLANAGRMIEDNPGLLQLRILQQLERLVGQHDHARRARHGRLRRPPRRADTGRAAGRFRRTRDRRPAAGRRGLSGPVSSPGD